MCGCCTIGSWTCPLRCGWCAAVARIQRCSITSAAARVREIVAEGTENRQDLHEFLRVQLQDTELAAADPERVAAELAVRSEGNFLYAAQAIAALRSGRLDPSRPEGFPEGLVGVYQAEFERLFPAGQGYAELRPLLEIVLAARESLTAAQLAAIAHRDPFDVEAALERLSAFFPCEAGRFRAYHKSITDWLAGRVGKSRTYRVSVRSGHERLAEWLWQQDRAGRRDVFSLSHLAAHLRGAERWSDLETLLTDLRYVETRCRAGRDVRPGRGPGRCAVRLAGTRAV